MFHYSSKPTIGTGCEVWVHKGCIGYGEFEAKTLPNWHQTILSREEYFHLYPEHTETEYKDGVKPTDPAKVEGPSKPTIEQLAADYRNRKDYADRKQQEADAAKADAEAKLAELVTAGKARGLVLSVADPEPELVITDWRDLQAGDIVEFLSGAINDWAGREVTVESVDVRDTAYHVLVSDAGGARWCRDFRFIRRP